MSKKRRNDRPVRDGYCTGASYRGPAHDVEVMFNPHGRALQLLTLPLRGGDHAGRVEIEEVLGKDIRVLRLHPESIEHIAGAKGRPPPSHQPVFGVTF